MRAVSDMPTELRATSDSLLRDLAALVELEEEKRATPPSNPRIQELSAHIDLIARRVLVATGRQKQLTEEVAESPAADVPIDDLTRSPAEILAEWRDIEQRRTAAAPDSAERLELEALADRIRAEYRQAYDQTVTKDPD